MKRITTIISLLLMMSYALSAQTLNVQMGDVVYQIPAAKAGNMLYQNSSAVTILNKEYSLSDVSQMYIDNSVVTDNTVCVKYNGSSAQVYVSGNVAEYLNVSVNGAHVSIEQGDAVSEEISYSLSGTSSDGEFYLSGNYKATVELAGLTLTNPSGAAICIMNGKRIDLSIKKDTQNTITDCVNGEQKAAIYCKGHLELKGKGTLNVNGLTAHAIKSAEYMAMKNCTVNVLQAIKDGLSCDEFFLMESGTLTVTNVGDDAIQCDLDGTTSTGELTDHEGEDTGNIYIEGGTLNLTVAASGAKCIKSSSGTVRVNGGEMTLKAGGNVDTTDSSDPSYASCIKGTTVVINGGTIGMTITGNAGRGISADTLETNGGEMTILNSGATQTVSSDVKSAKGLKATNMALNAGTISITMTGAAGKGIVAGDGTKSTSSSSGGGRPGGGGGMGSSSQYTNITGSFTIGKSDGTGPTLSVTTKGSAYSSSSAKAIKAICAAVVNGGQTEVYTSTDGAEGFESKTSVTINGGNHYFQCYDDCINSAGKIIFDGGVSVCYSYGNDAVDSNAGTTGAITIGNGTCFAFTTKGAPEEGFDCDNNSYIQITGTGIGISAGAAQGGGGGGRGGSSSNTISNAKQGYAFVTSSISYAANRYYTLADNSDNNLVTYSFPALCNSTLALFTAKGMVKNSTYNVKYSNNAPTDATTAWHGIYLGSSHKGTTSVTSFTAK